MRRPERHLWRQFQRHFFADETQRLTGKASRLLDDPGRQTFQRLDSTDVLKYLCANIERRRNQFSCTNASIDYYRYIDAPVTDCVALSICGLSFVRPFSNCHKSRTKHLDSCVISPLSSYPPAYLLFFSPSYAFPSHLLHCFPPLGQTKIRPANHAGQELQFRVVGLLPKNRTRPCRVSTS